MWEYEEIESVNSIPKELYFELLGSRKDIIFVEGKNESYDLNIYESIFKSYTIKPLGSCSKVIESTKAFNDLKQFHNISAYGIIDRDRRSQEEVNGYERKGIYIPKVAEVDNLFMIEDVIRLMCRIKRKHEDEIFNTIKDNVFETFIREKERQIKELSIYQIKEKIRNLIVGNENKETFNEFVDNLKDDLNSFNYSEIYTNNEDVLNNILESRNYEELIKIFNCKAIIGESQILSLCEFKNKKAYIDFVLTIVKENSEDGEFLRKAFSKYVEIRAD